MQLPTQDAPQSALKLLQQSFSPAHHESQKQPLGACEKQIPEHSPAAADRTRATAIERTARVMVIALPRYPADVFLAPPVTSSWPLANTARKGEGKPVRFAARRASPLAHPTLA